MKKIQVRVSDDDHSDVIVNHHACDNDYDIYVIHNSVRDDHDLVFKDDDDHNDAIIDHHASDSNYDIHVNNNTHIKNNDDGIYDNNNITYNNPFKYSIRIDNNDVPTDIYGFDTDYDCYNDHNNINITTCDYNNYDEDNNNHVDRYDVGIVQDDDLIENDRGENNYATSSVPCVLSSLGTIFIVYDSDPVPDNDHYIIRCDNTENTSPTISSLSSLTSFTIPFNLSILKTSSSSNRDTCVDCNSHNEVDTNLSVIPVHVRTIPSIPILFTLSNLEPTSLSSNLFRLSSDCGLVCLGYVSVALVGSLATTSSLSRSLSSSTFSSLFILDNSFVSNWPSSNAYTLDTIGSSFNPSVVSAFVKLHQLHLVLLSESSYFLGWYIASHK